MNKWSGSSAVCINEEGKVLMVLQGTPEEDKKWSVPSGGKEQNETFMECCIREVEEETGYIGEVLEEIRVKRTVLDTYEVEVYYYLVKIVGGSMKIQDPDQLIYDVAWKSFEELTDLEFSFPEDKAYLQSYIKSKVYQ